MKKIIIFIIILVAAVFIYNMTVSNEVKEGTLSGGVIGLCGLVIESHDMGEVVNWPIVVSGSVVENESEDNCQWQTYEGVSGEARFYIYEDEVWKEIGDRQIFGPEFSIDFNYTEIGLPKNNPIKIEFTEENPAVVRPSLVFELPLTLE